MLCKMPQWEELQLILPFASVSYLQQLSCVLGTFTDSRILC